MNPFVYHSSVIFVKEIAFFKAIKQNTGNRQPMGNHPIGGQLHGIERP